jgi:hypothetical protein
VWLGALRFQLQGTVYLYQNQPRLTSKSVTPDCYLQIFRSLVLQKCAWRKIHVGIGVKINLPLL